MKPIRLVIDRQTAEWTEMVAEDETTIRLPSAWVPEGAGVNEVVTLFFEEGPKSHGRYCNGGYAVAQQGGYCRRSVAAAR